MTVAAQEPEVRAFDPVVSLDGGSDGLDMYRRLARRIPAIVPAGWVFLEVGYDQAEAVAQLLGSVAHGANSPAFTFHRDVTGRRRCVAWKTRE